MIGLTDIQIFAPSKTKSAYTNPDDGTLFFPVTDKCERNAKLMGDDYVLLSFMLENKVVFEPFSYIEYNGQTFFLKEQYIPKSSGAYDDNNTITSAYYTYSVKFYSIANMLSKHICFRHVVVGDMEFDEPEINVSATLDTMYDIVIGSIGTAIERLNLSHADTHYAEMLGSIFDNGARGTDGLLVNSYVRITPNTKLLSFSFSGDNIADVCTRVANAFTDDKHDTEWYIEEANGTAILHFSKCFGSEDDLLTLSDYALKNNGNSSNLIPYTSGGLSKVEYAQERTDIPQVMIPYGSDRNMTYAAVKGIDEVTNLQATYGKRLRLDGSTTYKVRDREGNEQTLVTDERGAIHVNGVNTGIECVEFFEEVYPQCHFKVTSVSIRNKRQDEQTIPEYTIEAVAVDGKYSNTYLTTIGFYPIQIEEGATLSIRFESGFLNGREFEVANKTSKDSGVSSYSLKVTIVADGSIEDGTLIPSGNFIPKVGDTFALFNMKMPSVFIDIAKQDLAQAAYEKLADIQDTRPEVKCTSDQTVFSDMIWFGRMCSVKSETFNNDTFKSRVISYSYKLSSPNNVTFNLASAIMRGSLSQIREDIAVEEHNTDILNRKSINLSRRGWRDASEMATMLESLTSEMMLVGDQQTQFAITSDIVCVNQSNVDMDGYKHFLYLKISAGQIIHTQEPYIGYANKGVFDISRYDLFDDYYQNELDSSKPYYLYAIVSNINNSVEMALFDERQSGEQYLLVGILSSEFEDGDSSYRVFNRTNGYTSIAGGTITAEQLQDANRNLIIDFLNQRIIARRGAEIIGNIRFLSNDGKEAVGGITTIDGGLLLSQILQLSNGETVTAGMSGRNEDEVLLWGGGTYEDACNNLESVVTRITKSGLGRIGCLRIVDKDTIAVISDNGTLYITNKSISSFATFETQNKPLSLDFNADAPTQNKSFSVSDSYYLDLPAGSYNLVFPQTVLEAWSLAEYIYSDSDESGSTGEDCSISAVFEVYVQRYIDAGAAGGAVTTEASFVSETFRVENNANVMRFNIPEIKMNIKADGSRYRVVCRIRGVYAITTDAQYNIASAGCRISNNATLSNVDRLCVYGNDGITISNGSNYTFKVLNSESSLNIIANGLPTNNTNLSQGQLYNDNGTIKIKQ